MKQCIVKADLELAKKAVEALEKKLAFWKHAAIVSNVATALWVIAYFCLR